MIRPFLKWAGGKSRVLPDLLPHLPKADCLVEPFVGGASVFLNTDYRHYLLSDINPDLINLYRKAARHTDLLIDAARALFNDSACIERYSLIRNSFNTRLNSNSYVYQILRAAQFLYLNRHCFNGVCRYNKSGGFNVPFGKYEKVYFPENEIRLFAEKANDTSAMFLCLPFNRSLSLLKEKECVVYCDPPYVPASKTASFTQYNGEMFTDDNHRQLVSSLIEVNKRLGVPVIISSSDTPTTREIYNPFSLHEIDVQRSVSANARNRNKAKEVIGTLSVVENAHRRL